MVLHKRKSMLRWISGVTLHHIRNRNLFLHFDIKTKLMYKSKTDFQLKEKHVLEKKLNFR